jgi:predicted NBD/HSP70 family sugar kinase
LLDTTSAPTIRQITLRSALRSAMDGEPISRAELARVTGLSKQTMSEVVRELEQEGWLQAIGRTKGNVGRSAVTYELQSRRAVVLGVHLGSLQVRAALADIQGTIIAESEAPTDRRGGAHVLDQIAQMHAELCNGTGLDPRLIQSGAIGVPGAVDPRSRRVTMVPGIAGLEGMRVEVELSKRLGFPVSSNNTVNLAAKGEQWLGTGQRVDSFVFMSLSTGIGMGIINERKIVGGARGAAGEIAGLPLGADPFDPRSFALGALESAVGRSAISERYAGRTGQAGVDVNDILTRMAQGDAEAETTIDEIARILATAILSVTRILDPELVVFGGPIGMHETLLDRVRPYLARCMPTPIPCTVSQLGDRAGLCGAIAWALDQLRETMFAVPASSFETPADPKVS